MWRALLQWLGGWYCGDGDGGFADVVGCGMQLFRTESYERAENVVPRATQLAWDWLDLYRPYSHLGYHACACRHEYV